MPDYTINVSGAERDMGEKPYTYAVEADDMAAAKLLAYRWHLWEQYSEYGKYPAVDEYRPDMPDVVVIDCPEFPCHEGPPAEDCGYAWNDLRDGRLSEPYLLPLDVADLRSLGYQVDGYPEETTW